MNEGNPDIFPAGITTDAPTAEQTALLRHFDLLPAEGITQTEAGALIDQLEAAPDWQPHLQDWHRTKSQLHPEIFTDAPEPVAAAPQRSYREARWWQSQINDGSSYGRSFRQPAINEALAVLESLDRQSPGWDQEGKKRRAHRFMNALAALSPELCKPGCSFPRDLPPEGDESEDAPPLNVPDVPAMRAPSAPFVPSPYAATSAPPSAPSQPVWQPPVQLPTPHDVGPSAPARRGAGKWALALLLLAAGAGAYGYFGFRVSPPTRDNFPALSTASADHPPGPVTKPVAVLPTLPAKDSQHRAMEKYPDLGKGGSPLNKTFVAMVHQLEVERSPRLQQSDWPERLADECARALVIKPVGQKPASPAPTPNARKTSAASPAPSTQGTDPTPTVPAVVAAVSDAAPAVTVAAAPSAAPRPSPGSLFVTMDAVNKASVNNYTYNWVSFYGDYDISFRQSVGIEAKVRNMARTNAPVTLRWAFFSRSTQHSRQRSIFAAAEKHLEIAPGQTSTETLDSPMVHSTMTVYYDYGSHYLSGSKYEGWLVQLVAEGSDQVIRQVGSTSYLEEYGKRSDFGTLIKQAMGNKNP